MAYRFLTDLGAAFDAAGVPWIGVGAHPADPTGASSWETRGRPSSTGAFDPAGILCHHTASPPSTTPAGDLNVILAGNGSAPGPISQLYIGRDAQLYLVAAGRANHGGSGVIPGESAPSDMNARLVGIEVGNDGVGEHWSDPVCELYGRTVAALAAFYGWPIDSTTYLHATTGPPAGNHKIDPAGPWHEQPGLPGGGAGTWDLGIWRGWCSSFLTGPTPGPTPPHPEDDDMAKCIVHVDDSQPAGSAGYYRFNAVWLWNWTTRRHLPSETAVRQMVYEVTGDATVWAAPLGDIIRNPEWVQPVGSLEGYGAVIGPDPGDV